MTRMMKFNSVFFFSAAALLSLIVACSNGEDTAGVISETESGKTIAGIITNNEGKPLARARVYIVGVDTASYHTYAMDSTETDEDGHYSIYTSGDQGFYRVYAKAASSSETLIGYEEYDGYSDSILNNRTLDSLQFDITVDVPGSLPSTTCQTAHSCDSRHGKKAPPVPPPLWTIIKSTLAKRPSGAQVQAALP